MRLLTDLKARFPKLYPLATLALGLGAVGGVAAYERASSECCYPGAACCHPGAACCAGHKVASK